MNTFDEIFQKIKEYDTIILHRHTSPDPDAIGSQAGLAFSLRLAFPDKKILCAGVDLGDLGWINTMDDVKDEDYQGALVITTDTANVERVSDQRFDQGDFLIKIDHHPDRDPYGDMRYVDEHAPAASQIIAEFLIQEKLPITKDVATALYAGIIGDTGRFMYSDTNQRTFEIAGLLKSIGIDITEIARTLSDVTFEQAKLQGLCLDRMKLDDQGRCAMAVISQADLKNLGLNADEASVTVNTPGRIKTIKCWNVFVEKEDGSYRVHYRSKAPVINHLAEKHNGGGHALASGANAKDLAECQQVFDEIVEVTNEYYKDHE